MILYNNFRTTGSVAVSFPNLSLDRSKQSHMPPTHSPDITLINFFLKICTRLLIFRTFPDISPLKTQIQDAILTISEECWPVLGQKWNIVSTFSEPLPVQSNMERYCKALMNSVHKSVFLIKVKINRA